MASLPSYVCVTFAAYSESFDPSVERVEMERGPAKQKILNTRVSQEINAQFKFSSKADAEAFESWYFNVIGRIGYFDMLHPRLGQIISARFKGGDIGELVPLVPNFSKSYRTVTLEYLR